MIKEKHKTTIMNEAISETIAKILCNKTIVYSDEISQNKNTIYAKNYYWILHEIGHYIACDEMYKDSDNLELRVLSNDSIEPNSERELSEEYCAVVIGNHLYFNYINDNINEYRTKMHFLYDKTAFHLDSPRYKKFNINKEILDNKCKNYICWIDDILKENNINKI